jgi:beta-lactamase superfamily II metal-dependent hydrolase
VNCEIEFLPVGEASKAGDAIVIRFGDSSAYELMVVDGGTVESGKALVEHVRSQFGAGAVISHAVLTHPDGDHASGLREVLQGLPVRNLWLHVPWIHAAEALPYFAHKGWTEKSLSAAIRKEYSLVEELLAIAAQRRMNVFEPFSNDVIGPFRVLSPHRNVYPALLAQFDRTPEVDEVAVRQTGAWIGKEPNAFARLLEKVAAKVQKWVGESWAVERLKDGGVTSATNESSVVLYGDFGPGRKVLLTGDAGAFALTFAAEIADASGLPLQQFMFVQVPHHGSRRNVGPTVLNRILGPIQAEGAPSRFTAFVSAPKDDDSHPRKIVTNAFVRRGGRVSATQGRKKVFWGGFPPRAGYENLTLVPLATRVEDYDD